MIWYESCWGFKITTRFLSWVFGCHHQWNTASRDIYGGLQFINWDLMTRGPETEKETRITVGVVTLKQYSIMVKSMSFGVQPN